MRWAGWGCSSQMVGKYWIEHEVCRFDCALGELVLDLGGCRTTRELVMTEEEMAVLTDKSHEDPNTTEEGFHVCHGEALPNQHYFPQSTTSQTFELAIQSAQVYHSPFLVPIKFEHQTALFRGTPSRAVASW